MSIGGQLRRQLSPEYRDETLRVLRRIVEAVDGMKFQRHQDGTTTVEQLPFEEFRRLLDDLERARYLTGIKTVGAA